jgi:N-acetyl-gamma-glutamyl-phosphate reductase
MSIRVGIIGVSGFGGGEVLRLCAGHPAFEVVYVSGESTAGKRIGEIFPSATAKLTGLRIEPWEPETLPEMDLVFASLPTGASSQMLGAIPSKTKIVDIGGDHRYVAGWAYGLADVWAEKIRGQSRIANPGCYPAATLLALAPLLRGKLIEPHGIIVDAKSGVSGAGRGGDSKFGYAQTAEDFAAYGLLKHPHMPEICRTISDLSGVSEAQGLVFTPHLVPMTRGILATVYAKGKVTTEQCLEAARKFYADRPFVRVTDRAPHTKWASGTNLAFVSYAADPERNLVIAMGAIDNLGKGAAGQAVQNANLMTDQPETAGLEGMAMWP